MLVENRYPLLLVIGDPITIKGEAIRFTQQLWVTKKRKTRLMDLSDRERISMNRSAVLIQYTRVTDGRTYSIVVTRATVYMLSRVKILCW